MLTVYADQLPTLVGTYLRKTCLKNFHVGDTVEISEVSPYVKDEDLVKLYSLYGLDKTINKLLAKILVQHPSYDHLLKSHNDVAELISLISTDGLFSKAHEDRRYHVDGSIYQVVLSQSYDDIITYSEVFDSSIKHTFPEYQDRQPIIDELYRMIREDLNTYLQSYLHRCR
jgi:hypothetical protein